MGDVKLCDGCNVREPWEHRCHGDGCPCEECRQVRAVFGETPQETPPEWRPGQSTVCIHCGGRIVLVNYAMGPAWTHQPEGAAFSDGQHDSCHTTVATPGEWREGRLIRPERPGICVHHVGTTPGMWCSACRELAP